MMEEKILSPQDKKARRYIYGAYIAFAALVFTAILMPLTLFLAIGASLKRRKLKDTRYDSHLLWMIYTFIALIIGLALTGIFTNGSIPQKITIGLVFVLVLYRLGKGIFYIHKNLPIPKATAIL